MANIIHNLNSTLSDEEKVTKTFDAGVTNLWGYFKDGVIKTRDEVCGKKRGRRRKGNT